MGEEQTTKKNNSRKAFFIAAIIILALVNGGQAYLQWMTNKEFEETVNQKDSEIEALTAKADSVINELTIVQEELAALGADTAELGNQIRELIVERNKYRDGYQSGWNAAARLKKEIAAKVTILNTNEERIQELEARMAKQDTIIIELKEEKVALNDTISGLKRENEEQAETIEKASVLSATDFKFSYLRKGKEFTKTPFKRKKMETLRVVFNLAKNEIADREGKDLLFRLIDPSGSELYEEQKGGGSFTFQDKGINFTQKQNVLYTGKGQLVTFDYQKGSPYDPGQHKVEIYCEGELIGKNSFVTK